MRELWGHRAGRRALALLAFSVLLLIAYRSLISPALYSDLTVYRAEGLALRHGDDPYGPLPGVPSVATYPVFAVVLFLSTTLLPHAVAAFLIAVANVALTPVVAVLAFWIAGRHGRDALVAGLTLGAIGLWLEPVYTTFDYGQINLMLLALVLVDFLPGERSRRWTRGIGVGLAAAIKVTPLIFIVYLVLVRRWRTAATAVVTFALAQAVALSVDAPATYRYWTKYLFDLPRVGRLENSVNQTIRGLAVRIEHTRSTGAAVTVIVPVVAIAGLAIAKLAHDRLGEAQGLVACAVTGLLVSPISWSHHWVWCLPIVATLWCCYSRALAIAAAVAFASFEVWWLPHGNHLSSPELRYAPWQVAASGLYVYLGLAFVILTGVLACRPARGHETVSGCGWPSAAARAESARPPSR